ncbi:MAG TPA: hypothetical protein VIT65_26490 [Microlunatus sp.]
MELIRDAAEGRGRALLICGEPGIADSASVGVIDVSFRRCHPVVHATPWRGVTSVLGPAGERTRRIPGL